MNQGIHNIFIVIPQFIITGLAAIIFAIFEPGKSIHGSHPGGVVAPINGTSVSLMGRISTNSFLSRQVDEGVAKEGVNSVAVVFRLAFSRLMLTYVLQTDKCQFQSRGSDDRNCVCSLLAACKGVEAQMNKRAVLDHTRTLRLVYQYIVL
jgi:hypothetical protein